MLTKSLIFIAIPIVLAGCYSKNPNEPFSASLITVPGARDVTFIRASGRDQLTYSLDVAYPALQIIEQISKSLAQQGWTPMKESWLNPGLESSHVRGWTDFGDQTTNPRSHVFQWLAEWQDARKNVVCYVLQYRDKGVDFFSDADAPETFVLELTALYYPKDVAASMTKWAKEDVTKWVEEESKRQKEEKPENKP